MNNWHNTFIIFEENIVSRQTFSEYVDRMEDEVKTLMANHKLPLKLHHSNNNKGTYVKYGAYAYILSKK